MVLDASLDNTQQYKVNIESKVEESRERSSAPLHLGVVAIEKGVFWSPSTMVANFIYFIYIYIHTYIYIYIYIYIYMCVCVCVWLYLFCLFYRWSLQNFVWVIWLVNGVNLGRWRIFTNTFGSSRAYLRGKEWWNDKHNDKLPLLEKLIQVFLFL